MCYVHVGMYACLNFLDKMTVGTPAGNVNTFSLLGQNHINDNATNKINCICACLCVCTTCARALSHVCNV